jgi:hypothetical protein
MRATYELAPVLDLLSDEESLEADREALVKSKGEWTGARLNTTVVLVRNEIFLKSQYFCL